MAAKTLDELLGSLSADEKKILEITLTKNPELKAGWMAQDDYSRKTQALADDRKKLQDKIEHADKLEAWGEVNVPRYNQLIESGLLDDQGNELWTAQKTALETELEAARKAAVGGEMDPAELDKRVREIVKANGGVTPEELKALIATEATKLAEEKINSRFSEEETKFNEKTIPFVAGFSSGVAVVASKYERETSKPWTADTAKELFALMTEKKNFDPYAMGEEFLKPHKAIKDTEAEIQRRVQEELSKRTAPGGGNETYIPQSQEKGNLLKMMERSAGEVDFESLIMSQAAKAGEELRTGK